VCIYIYIFVSRGGMKLVTAQPADTVPEVKDGLPNKRQWT
jgi:hypothetical protein